MNKFKAISTLCYLWLLAFSWSAKAELSTDLFHRNAFTTLSKFLKNPELVSIRSREIILMREEQKKSSPENPRPYRFLIQGGLHGNEKLSSSFVLWLAQRFKRGISSLNKLPLGHIIIDFVPTANPDGAAQNQRQNARGVNLNRNFNVLWGLSRENPGITPFSEPETKAIQQLMTYTKYDAAIDVHGYINWIVVPSPPTALKGDFLRNEKDMQRWQAWLDIAAEQMKQLPGYKLKTAAQLGDGGAFEDYAFWEQKVPALCLEIKYRNRHTSDPSNPKVRLDWFLIYEKMISETFRQAAVNRIKLAGS